MAHLNIGLIGCGGIAASAHVPALQRLTSLVNVRIVCDVRPEQAQQAARMLDCAWSTDYHAVVEEPAVDAVLICTPEFLHAEQTIAAAANGKHVLCEKPMARTLAEADAMLAAAEHANVKLMIAHSRRFTARYQRAHELLEAGAIGQPVLVRENERRARASGSMPSGWRPDPTTDTTWYTQARYSTGTVFHIGVHEMDLMRWFAGSEARSVYMESKVTGPDQEVPDTVSIHVAFENGVLGACTIFNQAPHGYPNYHEFEVFGSQGVLRSRDFESLGTVRFEADRTRYPTASESLLLVGDAYALEQRLFFESVLNDTRVPLDPWHGRAALEMALAAVQSSATGEHVRLPLANRT